MAKTYTLTRVLVFAVLVVLVAKTASMAASKETRIGVVDARRVFKDARRIKQYSEDLNALGQLLQDKLDIRQQNVMLDQNEVGELLDLKLKTNPTDKDKSRITELAGIGRTRDEEVRKLNETRDLTNEQKVTQKHLMDTQKKSKDTIALLTKDYAGQLSSKSADLEAKAEADMYEATKAVAEAMGLTTVLHKDIYVEEQQRYVPIVVWGGVDITDNVIARLDRDAKQ